MVLQADGDTISSRSFTIANKEPKNVSHAVYGRLTLEPPRPRRSNCVMNERQTFSKSSERFLQVSASKSQGCRRLLWRISNWPRWLLKMFCWHWECWRSLREFVRQYASSRWGVQIRNSQPFSHTPKTLTMMTTLNWWTLSHNCFRPDNRDVGWCLP